jgi:pimeloyl-ACP methyl ester carboxylesterase
MSSRKTISRFMLVGAMMACLVPVSFPAFGAGPKGTVYQFVVPKQINLVSDPTYYCWLPEAVGTVRCIIVHQHGCSREERDPYKMPEDVQWKTLAKKWHAAFIAPKLVTGTNCANWNDPANGSENTFLAALDTLARRTGHAEIVTVPWAIWGHSGGSMWTTSMLGKYPGRFAVAVAQSCGSDISSVPAALKVPVLHHNGKSDLCYNDALFENGRKKGALWAHAVNPFVTWVYNPGNDPLTMMGHAPKDLRMIAIDWIDICLSMRLPDQAGSSLLRDMDTTNAWLGDTATRAIASAATFAGNKLSACWFPNQYFAIKWQEYMATSSIKDSTPPPAPYNLTGVFAGKKLTIKWDADADLETGIKTFIVYRNNAPYDTLTYPNAPQSHFTLEKGFQRWNDGDEPIPSPAPDMTFTDSSVNDTGTYAYQVACVNWLDGVGPQSGPFVLKRGQVTAVRAQPSTGHVVSHASLLLRTSIGKGMLNLSPGNFCIYDTRGRLLASVNAGNEGAVDIRRLLGNKVENVLIVKTRAR